MSTRSARGGAAKPASAQVRAYLAALPADVRRVVRRLGAIVRASAPGAVDAFGYGIPAFRLQGRPLLYYAGWKRHVSLYPLTAKMRRAAGPEMKRFHTAKGTIRFDVDEPLPESLVVRLVEARVAEMKADKHLETT